MRCCTGRLLHGGKYQFGSAGINLEGQQFAESGYGSSSVEKRHCDFCFGVFLYALLEEHKNKELLSQHEKAKDARLVLEGTISEFCDDIEKETSEFEKERTNWELLVKE